MIRRDLENLLALVADIVRIKPEIQAHRVPITVMKLRRLQSSIHTRDQATQSGVAWANTGSYLARTQELHEKAFLVADEIHVPIRLGDNGTFKLVVNNQEREII